MLIKYSLQNWVCSTSLLTSFIFILFIILIDDDEDILNSKMEYIFRNSMYPNYITFCYQIAWATLKTDYILLDSYTFLSYKFGGWNTVCELPETYFSNFVPVGAFERLEEGVFRL